MIRSTLCSLFLSLKHYRTNLILPLSLSLFFYLYAMTLFYLFSPFETRNNDEGKGKRDRCSHSV